MKNAKELLLKIKQYDTIIISRHKNPDMDAIGSQVGLGLIIKHHFPKKQVYFTGDHNRMDFESLMVELPQETYKNALFIITDVAVKALVADQNYLLCRDVVVIDHHQNECDIENVTLKIVDTNAEAACLIIAEIFKELNLVIPEQASNYLMNGLITDSGRFQYIKNSKRLFQVASFLADSGADPRELYKWLYVETLQDRRLKIFFESKIIFDENIAYIKTTKQDYQKLNKPDFFSISRGMVNLMSGIEEIKIWANFTYNPENEKVICEFRSRNIPIVDIAKKYGGGGHSLACGATVSDFNEVDDIITDFKELIKRQGDK